ncbi:hypothetical protein FHX81_5891 [Saccharothrix saharensis]|uniref:Uncharacterized protein n=1 Tax=Saccharothrix saharensis TaxID=571190 RepID=A0A543JKV7_9PSEU|nr:hypothetical protein [Saccharothrix saharensis]TQM83466.1 hypothetical protein FHX81_5891 [Saccharothrix saharensis]
MTAIILALAVVALTVYGVERNHRRQPGPGSRLAGSTNTEDRDLSRVTADVRASAAHAPAARAAHRGEVTPLRSMRPARSA